MTKIAGWIWDRNLRGCLTLLAHYVGYEFDAADWSAVALAVAETDAEQPAGWYVYPLVGDGRRVDVRLARSVGGDEVSVTVDGDLTPELALRADTLLAAFAESV